MNDFSLIISNVQSQLTQLGMDGWLLFDFRHSNPLALEFLQISVNQKLTRRLYYWIPRTGNPLKIVSATESHVLEHLPGHTQIYKGHQELETILHSFAHANSVIAMEYSPLNSLPTIAKVDAGTIELVQKQGATVVSSADLLQMYTSVWTSEQWKTHQFAAAVLEKVVSQTWNYIENALLASEAINEYSVQQFMLSKIEEFGCWTENFPTCAVNSNSANPHYTPSEHAFLPICKDDFILLDLWCKEKKERAVYADITRVGLAGAHPSTKLNQVFTVVKEAQANALRFIQQRIEGKSPIQGWEVDRVCRDFISQAGYADFFVHRTGHNLGEEVHGAGANLDNFETHDFRQLLPGTAFTIEPGIYLPNEFGVRLEYDVYISLNNQVIVSGGIQREIHCFLKN